MAVTKTGSQGDGASETGIGPPESAEREHPANTLTATEPPTTQLDPATMQSEPATSPLLAGSMGDRCANCGTPMASDQRYCVHCGERRGAGRFGTMAAPTAMATKTVGPPPDRRSRPSAATWIAGIATLLIALGVGVLIGKAGNSSPAKASAPEVITVNGGGSASTGTSSGSSVGTAQGSSHGTTHHSTGTTTHTSAKHAATKAKAAAKASKPTTSAVHKASQASSGVTGGSGAQSNNTVTTGGSCKAGSAGCTNGHFTGNFFGGG